MNADLRQLLSFIPEEQKRNLDLSDPETLRLFLAQQLAALKPLGPEEYLERLAKNELRTDDEGGLLVEPRKEFVLKARLRHSGQKLFINVTSHPLIDEPEQTELAGEGESGEASEGVRLPMSVGELSDVPDKKGRPSRAVDVIVNHSVLARLRQGPVPDAFDPETLDLFANVVFGYLNQKYRLEFEGQGRVLRSVAYMGSYVRHQRVKAKKKPRIQAVPSEAGTQGLKASFFEEASADKQMVPEWGLQLLFGDGTAEDFDGFNFDDEVVGLRVTASLALLSTGGLTSEARAGGPGRAEPAGQPRAVPARVEIAEAS